jgi:predicted RNA-binding Zn-ribbon protein involved in translation (DUF1610 family)
MGERPMPVCKICGKRIEVAKTGVKPHVCRICGRVVCRDDYNIVRQVCKVCLKGS